MGEVCREGVAGSHDMPSAGKAGGPRDGDGERPAALRLDRLAGTSTEASLPISDRVERTVRV